MTQHDRLDMCDPQPLLWVQVVDTHIESVIYCDGCFNMFQPGPNHAIIRIINSEIFQDSVDDKSNIETTNQNHHWLYTHYVYIYIYTSPY